MAGLEDCLGSFIYDYYDFIFMLWKKKENRQKAKAFDAPSLDRALRDETSTVEPTPEERQGWRLTQVPSPRARPTRLSWADRPAFRLGSGGPVPPFALIPLWPGSNSSSSLFPRHLFTANLSPSAGSGRSSHPPPPPSRLRVGTDF